MTDDPHARTEPIGTKLVYEDRQVRIWTLELAPGQSTALHQHTCDYVYVVVSPGKTVTHILGGKPDHNVDEIGVAVYHDAGPPHLLENVGSTRYANVIVELIGHVRAEKQP